MRRTALSARWVFNGGGAGQAQGRAGSGATAAALGAVGSVDAGAAGVGQVLGNTGLLQEGLLGTTHCRVDQPVHCVRLASISAD